MARSTIGLVALTTVFLTVPQAAVTAAPKPSTQSRSKPLCLPPYFAGLLAGSSTAREVRRLHGDGYESERNGEPVRLFTTASRSGTLVVLFGTDSIVSSIDMWDRLESGLNPAAVERMVSPYLRTTDGIGNWGAIHLGDTQAAVTSNLGAPSRVRTEDGLLVWAYESVCSCEISTGFSFRFKGDRLVSFGV